MFTLPEISFEEVTGRNGNLGLITLRRQKKLNALTGSMISALSGQLQAWEAASQIKAVVIRAVEGRVFCAGGDIRLTWENRNQRPEKPEKSKESSEENLVNHFFYLEYLLNRRIHFFRKPYLALLDGIVMGGGAGISMHGSHRIATDKLVFAMPETGIGFFPDVGMLWVLSRLPHRLGYWLALTGESVGLSDCVVSGLVSQSVRADIFPELIYALADTPLSETFEEACVDVTRVIEPFSQPCLPSELFLHRAVIDACFSKKTLEDILSALDKSADFFCQQTAEILRRRSPSSLKVTLMALQKAGALDFDESLEMEYALTCHFLEGHDFFEGIRAAVIDRDKKPVWKPASLVEVSDKMIRKYFEPPLHPLVTGP